MHHVHRLILIVCLLLVPGAAAGQQAVPPLPAPQGPPATIPAGGEASRPSFEDWLADLRKEALALGISERTVEAALSGVEPLPVVVERDRTQAERVLPLDEYLRRRLDRKTVRTARAMAARHRALLTRVSRRYRVPSSLIVSVWGLESNFGRFSGVRPTVAALATLAYDDRRGSLFRGELFDALRILDRGDIEIGQMKGSWAGAMGQPQFMPSSYLRFAQDFDEDGKTDVWRSQADVFASIANYLARHGWQAGAGWGRSVTLPAAPAEGIAAAAPLRTSGCAATREMTEALPWSKWKTLGVRLSGAQTPPAAKTAASLVRAGSRAFLVFDNYHAILDYNCAHAYALGVALLSDRISTPAARPR